MEYSGNQCDQINTGTGPCQDWASTCSSPSRPKQPWGTKLGHTNDA